jgi:hypothetical protein
VGVTTYFTIFLGSWLRGCKACFEGSLALRERFFDSSSTKSGFVSFISTSRSTDDALTHWLALNERISDSRRLDDNRASDECLISLTKIYRALFAILYSMSLF